MLGYLIDRRLTLLPHVIDKIRLLKAWLRLLRPILTSNHTKLSVKFLFYKLIWTYGLQLWGTAKMSNINRIQRFQWKIHLLIYKAPFYVFNHNLHPNHKILLITEIAKLNYKRFNYYLAHQFSNFWTFFSHYSQKPY